jgi:hypothetical protein
MGLNFQGQPGDDQRWPCLSGQRKNWRIRLSLILAIPMKERTKIFEGIGAIPSL